MSQGKQSFRVDVNSSGHVFGVGVNKKIATKFSLSNIVFSTARGSKIKALKGYRATKGTPAQARRVGTMCVVSGSMYNPKIRSGVHCTLKHSGAVGKLPQWCRPTRRMIFTTVAKDGKVQRIDVLPQGTIRWTAGKRAKTVNLTGIRFTIPRAVAKRYSRGLKKVTKCL